MGDSIATTAAELRKNADNLAKLARARPNAEWRTIGDRRVVVDTTLEATDIEAMALPVSAISDRSEVVLVPYAIVEDVRVYCIEPYDASRAREALEKLHKRCHPGYGELILIVSGR
ncbi:MAG: hypothetical protein ACHREM_00220 [Polyangiales bacterium]